MYHANACLICRDNPITDTARRVASRQNSRQNSGHLVCEQCDEYGPDRDYCSPCDSTFCENCWRAQLPHKKQRLALGSIPHEKSDYHTAMKIKTILEAETTSAEQDMLHKHDEDTTWFGIIREDAELPLFRDYGRYANIMTSSLNASSHNSSEWTPGARDHRFPSLVSFVGQTG